MPREAAAAAAAAKADLEALSSEREATQEDAATRVRGKILHIRGRCPCLIGPAVVVGPALLRAITHSFSAFAI